MPQEESYYGGHISIKNGVVSAILQINEIGGNMIQIFISSPVNVKSTVSKALLEPNECTLIKETLKTTNSKIVVHLPYVINIAKPLYQDISKCWWIDTICKQLTVSDSIGSIGCVIHVGKYLELTELEGLDNMFKSLVFVTNYIKEHNLNTHIILETSSGQGSELLSTENNSLSDLANFYNRFNDEQKKYLKICVDTCHIFVAGYDIRKKEQVKQFFNEFNTLIGIENLDLIHLNDTKSEYSSNLDRHENIGDGKIGLEGLRHIIRYGIYYKIPLILETPDNYEQEIKLINKVKNGVDNWKSKK